MTRPPILLLLRVQNNLFFFALLFQGCDASVLVRGNATERSDPGNASLGGFDLIESAKNVLEIFCPGIVSCADILVLAARDAVEAVRFNQIHMHVDMIETNILYPNSVSWLCEYSWFGKLGGPVVAIPTGRRDGTVSAAENVRPNIIDTDFTVDKMISIFSSKGLSVQDLVVLSGMFQKQEVLFSKPD